MAQAANTIPEKPVSYNIVDGKTGAIVGKAKTLARARASVDRRDNAYGGYRYRAVPVYAATV